MDTLECSTCRRENRHDARFCDGCGVALATTCSGCGRELRTDARFCDGCGQPRRARSDLNSAQSGPAVARAALRPTEAERRQLTVMFCDLVGSTALSGRLDPEDLREVVRAYQAAAGEVVRRFEGHVAQYLGDGLLVYFGYPQAHEDAAYRGVRTGLEIVDAVRKLNTHLERDKDVRLAVRLAIHTGPAVIGEMGGADRRELLALGETPIIAARLQELAEPDEVVISAATARLVQRGFALEEMGTYSLKGVDEPISAWRVHGLDEEKGEEADAQSTPLLVGRNEEVDLLKRCWEQSQEGLGQVVLISGEAGIGKSALVDSIRSQAQLDGGTRMTFRCSAHHQNSPLHPITQRLSRRLRFTRDDTPEAKLVKLERMLENSRFSQDEAVCLLADLLSIPVPEDRHPPLALSPPQQRQRTHEALAALLVEETERQPVLVVIEDLHWIDPSTLEVVGLLVEQVPTVRMLIALTFRPDFVPPWPPHAHVVPLRLSRLLRPEVEAIVSHLAGGKVMPTEVIEHLVSRTDGVPLFVEELTKMVLESNVLTALNDHYEVTGPLSERTIPSTLQDSLMARLDRLPGVREVAQVGAVLGREFSYELVRALTTTEENLLRSRLELLVDAALVYQRGRPPHSSYVFKHALIQDAAYSSLLRRTRQKYHRQIAELFEERFPEILETQPELVAHHYTYAGLMDQALGYWQQAGRIAAQRSANAEAIAHLTKGLDVLSALSDGPERVNHELDLQMTLASALTALRGHGAPEVERRYARARELCERTGDTQRLFRVLAGICAYYIARGPASTAHELANQLLPLAEQQRDARLSLTAHANLGATSFLLGEFTSAGDHLEQGISLSEARPREGRPVQDQGVICYSWVALNLFVLGYPDQAMKRSQAALSLARSLDSPYSLGFALYFASFFHKFRRDGDAAQACAEEGMLLSSEEFALWWAGAKLYRGWALAERGHAKEGLVQVREGLDAWLATGAQVSRPHYLALLAELHMELGESGEGLRRIDEALAAQEKLGEEYYDAELYRLMGELLLVQECEAMNLKAHRDRAQACFQRALEISRRQSAKLWELRAGMSLARLWRQDRKEAEARRMLSEIYDWFTEGFDIKDLQEAKALLRELS